MATKSQKQERRIAQEVGGRLNSGSGNGLVHKNDVRTADTSIEAKFTDAASYRLYLSDLIKAENHALLSGRDFLFILTMGDRDWVVMPYEDYAALKEPDGTDPSG